MWKFIMVRLWIKFLILAKITTEEKRIHIIESWAKTVNGKAGQRNFCHGGNEKAMRNYWLELGLQ